MNQFSVQTYWDMLTEIKQPKLFTATITKNYVQGSHVGFLDKVGEKPWKDYDVLLISTNIKPEIFNLPVAF